MRADPFLIQRSDEGIGALDCDFLCPNQAVKGAENHVGCLGKALGLDRDAKLVPGALGLLAQASQSLARNLQSSAGNVE